MFKSHLIKHFQLFKLDFLNIAGKLPDEELMPRLRTVIHVLEKRNLEEKTNFLYYIKAHKYYFEAKKRDLLSSEEKDWCEKILFGKSNNKKLINHKKYTASREFLDVLKNRRSVRIWEEAELDNEVFKELIDAAKWAPSSCNRQPWSFIVTKNKDKIELLYNIKGQKFLKDAPNCILVLINKKAWGDKKSFEYFSGLDAGAAIQNLLLKAEDMGLGACWVNWNPKSLSQEDERKVKEKFNIPENFEIISIIPIGESESSPSAPGRKDTLDLIHFEIYNNK